MDRRSEVSGRMNGHYYGDGFGPLSHRFLARATEKTIVLFDEADREICRSQVIQLRSSKNSTFTLFGTTLGNGFHWEKREDQTFQGDLTLRLHKDGTITVINKTSIEDYLKSVISSEMNPASPMEFLKSHAILSRSWVLSGLGQRKRTEKTLNLTEKTKGRKVLRWYGREDHDLFDVCAGDHCQRYYGIGKKISRQAEEAVQKTQGMVITFQNKICDARYSKACGGFTEEYDTAWEDRRVPYLKGIPDASSPYQPIKTEEEARRWIVSEPNAYCNTKELGLLKKILPGLDRKTKNFFRWTVQYSRKELEKILQEKSGFDFGALQEIVPLQRGPSGRISHLKIVGSKRSLIVGKELEIRRWLSPTHLYSSAFIVKVEANQFIFQGAGWGHGVGLCQIGAAVMATQGFSTEQILKHYFRGIEIKKIY